MINRLRTRRVFVAATLLCLLSAAVSVAQDGAPPTLRAGAPPASLRVDGVLDEGEWAQAEANDGFTQTDPHEGAPPTGRTLVRVLAGPKALVIGIVCDEPDPSGIVSFSVRRDATLTSEDHVRVVLFFDQGNAAWKPVISGFEIQVDDNARGDSSKDFYGIRPEPDGKFKNRTGAIYKIQAGDRVWHLNINEPAVQNYTPGPARVPGVWFEYEIELQGDAYTVFLTNLQSGQRVRTTTFTNTDGDRGRAPGFIGVQAYPGSTVAWRHIRIKPL